jgi:phospholipid/cholesterol/gamma-HCH transport system ATP-binding protein
MITHDLETLNAVCDRVAALYQGRIIAEGPVQDVMAMDHPWLQSYFRGERGRAIHWAR